MHLGLPVDATSPESLQVGFRGLGFRAKTWQSWGFRGLGFRRRTSSFKVCKYQLYLRGIKELRKVTRGEWPWGRYVSSSQNPECASNQEFGS